MQPVSFVSSPALGDEYACNVDLYMGWALAHTHTWTHARPPSGSRVESRESAQPKVLESGEEPVCQSSVSEEASSQIPHLVAVRDAIALTWGSRKANTLKKCNKENVNCIVISIRYCNRLTKCFFLARWPFCPYGTKFQVVHDINLAVIWTAAVLAKGNPVQKANASCGSPPRSVVYTL